MSEPETRPRHSARTRARARAGAATRARARAGPEIWAGDRARARSEEPGADPGDLLDLLSSPLDDGDELTAVLTRRPRAKLPSVTLILAAIVVASAGFLGGALVGKHYGSSGTGSLAAAFRGLAARASASPGASGGTAARGPVSWRWRRRVRRRQRHNRHDQAHRRLHRLRADDRGRHRPGENVVGHEGHDQRDRPGQGPAARRDRHRRGQQKRQRRRRRNQHQPDHPGAGFGG